MAPSVCHARPLFCLLCHLPVQRVLSVCLSRALRARACVFVSIHCLRIHATPFAGARAPPRNSRFLRAPLETAGFCAHCLTIQLTTIHAANIVVLYFANMCVCMRACVCVCVCVCADSSMDFLRSGVGQ